MVKNGNVRIMVTLTKKELDQLEKYSVKTGLSKTNIIKIALIEKVCTLILNSVKVNKCYTSVSRETFLSGGLYTPPHPTFFLLALFDK